MKHAPYAYRANAKSSPSNLVAQHIRSIAMASGIALCCLAAPSASAFFTSGEVSVMSVASVILGPSFAASDASGAVSGSKAAEVMMSGASGGKASFVVTAVTAVSNGTVYVVEQTSKGLKLSLQVPGQSLAKVGDTVSALARPLGVVVTNPKDEVMAFVPNAEGAKLLANEKVK
jgi:hypothetical protein